MTDKFYWSTVKHYWSSTSIQNMVHVFIVQKWNKSKKYKYKNNLILALSTEIIARKSYKLWLIVLIVTTFTNEIKSFKFKNIKVPIEACV